MRLCRRVPRIFRRKQNGPVDNRPEVLILTPKKINTSLVLRRIMTHIGGKPGATPGLAAKNGDFGSTARKEVIRCLMVQQRGRLSSARSIIARLPSAIKASWAALPGR